jgi:hypothetical protein
MKELVGQGKPFYSALDTGAKALKRKVGTGSEFLKELMALPGVKPTELKERGLEELMNAPKMTHEQFLSHLEQKSAPKIQEHVLGAGTHKGLTPNEEKRLKSLKTDFRMQGSVHPEDHNDFVDLLNRSEKSSNDTLEEQVESLSKKYHDAVNNGQRRLARELSDELDFLYDRQQRLNKVVEDPTKYAQFSLPGGENYREMLIKMPLKENEKENFYGGHWTEPNVLAHMRLKDRTGPNGEKLLHLDELQSDWHQAGRDKGYKESRPMPNMDASEILLEHQNDLSHAQIGWLRTFSSAWDHAERTNNEKQLDKLIDKFSEWRKTNTLGGIPDAPFKKNWEEMAIKRLIHHAAEKGYHGIVMTPGHEQANRYNLSKQVGFLGYHPEEEQLLAYGHDRLPVLNERGIKKEKIPEYIGKEATERLLNAPKVMGIHQLEGEDLNIGGKGMKSFYDTKVPNIFNAVGKKHGVQMALNAHKEELPQKNVYGDHPTEARTVNLHHFPITEPMREDVLKNGLPLYATGGVIHKAEGGNVQPSIEQMRQELQNKQTYPRFGIQSIGANEAPNMSPKYYIEPGVDGNPAVGGVDMNTLTPGMQLVQQDAQAMQPPQGTPPQGAQPPQSPLGAPPSNILQMTPQGQALGAMSPPQGQQPPQQLAEGGMAKGGIKKRQQTVKNAQRIAYPGIYGNPREIAELAASRVAPENPALKQLFGVTREDMFNLAQGRQGMPHLGMLPGAATNAKGAEASKSVMTPRNEQRLIDVMSEAGKHKELIHGMDPWYYMDPLFERMVSLLGLEKATEEYKKMNALMGMASSASEVNTEIPRGSAAYYMNKLGRFNEFVEHGGKRSPTRPKELGDIPGHLAHKTAHAVPMKKFLERGEVDMTSPKVPMYIEASGVPQTGFQTRTPVGDAHWSRAVGLADTRNPKTVKGVDVIPGASVTNPEMHDLGPWWRHQIASKLGLESVPAQARAWGAFSPQTGVTTPIGAPKLEMIAGQIMNTAKRLGVSPETARDMVLTGKERMGFKKGGKIDASLDTMRYALSKKN